MARYRSWPAVSQIWALMVFESTWMERVANSTPMVDLESRLNSLRVNRLSRFDFPTPESPIRTTVYVGRAQQQKVNATLVFTLVRYVHPPPLQRRERGKKGTEGDPGKVALFPTLARFVSEKNRGDLPLKRN